MPETNNPDIISLSDLSFLKKAEERRHLLALTMELTHRCNNNCVHCYINLPANDKVAIKNELRFKEIKKIMDQAFSMGTLWVLLSGGEPLLRDDFFDIYLYLKQKGFLVSVYTNASLVSKEHIDLFKKYPPRDIEVSVYGISETTQKKVTRKNTFSATMKGIERLISEPLPVTFKTTIMKSNYQEIKQISKFCKKTTKRPFRFDPFLNLRLDKDPGKNDRITRERLNSQEIIDIEKLDKKRTSAIEKKCMSVVNINSADHNRLFRCQAGVNTGCIDCYGTFKLCSTLIGKDCTYNLKNGSLDDAWNNFAPQIRMKKSSDPLFKTKCGSCNIIDLCMWCPAHSDLETGKLDEPVQYFCDIASKRYSYFHNDV